MRSVLQPSASRSDARPVPVLRRRPPAAVLPARGLQHKAAGRRGSWIAAASAEKQQVQEAGQRGRSGEAASRSAGSTADSSQGSGRRGLLGGSGRLALASVDEDASEGGLYNWSSSYDREEQLLDRDAFKEDSRRYFRTVFDHDRWAAHRSTRRYLRHVLVLQRSRMVRGLAAPLLYMAALTTSVALYHSLSEAGLVPQVPADLQIRSGEPFSLTSFALSLLLVFRTNASYARWLDARKAWGQVVTRCRDLVRQGITYFPADQPAMLGLLCRWTVAYSRSLMSHLRSDVDAGPELERVLHAAEAEAALAAQHRPNFCLQVLSETIKTARNPPPASGNGSRPAPATSEGAAMQMDQNLTHLQDMQGCCERILRTPIPLSYTRHTSRFMMIWLTLLPFCLWDSCRWATVPICLVIAFLLLGIEEIGVAIEEPFSILPLEVICDNLEANVWELQRMHAAQASGGTGDNGGSPRVLSASGVVQAAVQAEVWPE